MIQLEGARFQLLKGRYITRERLRGQDVGIPFTRNLIVSKGREKKEKKITKAGCQAWPLDRRRRQCWTRNSSGRGRWSTLVVASFTTTGDT